MLEAIHLGLVGRSGTLFDGVDATFREGDVWAITGPPSSGKSSLLQVVHGERKPDAGDVMIDGESLYRGTPGTGPRFRRVSALVHDIFEAGPHTVGDLFRLVALAAGDVPEGERKAREASLLSMVGLPGYSGFDFRSLSMSERLRAALAIELFRGPRVLLLDTPVSRIGREWTEMLCALFRALAREGRIILFAERELPAWFPMKPVGEPVSSGPFKLVQLASGNAGEGGA
jgi:ABC-type multidrug transport system ATPase subunit